MKNRWQADPKKYAELSSPFESVEQAQEVMKAFCAAVAKLREQYHIPEFIFRLQAYAKHEQGIVVLSGGAGFGNQLQQAQLAKNAFDTEFECLREMLEQITLSMPRLKRDLVTDPNTKMTDVYGEK